MPYKKNTTKQNNEQDNTKKQNNERDNTKEIRQAYISKHNDELCFFIKEIPVLFHNESVYDYHFIIKYLAGEFEGNFECLGENILVLLYHLKR